MTWLNWPNRISIGRILLVGPLVVCLLYLRAPWPGWRYLALAIFVVMAVSDVVDGYLARRLGEETPLGRFLDPLGDKLLITCAMILLALEPTAVPGFRLPGWVAVAAIGKDMLTVIGFLLIYAVTGKYFIRARVLGKACTTVQLVLVGFCLAAPDVHRVWSGVSVVFIILYSAATLLAVAALGDYVRIGTRFAAGHHPEPSRKLPDE